MNFILENCANSAESCLRAQNGGADRVELCAGIPEGGTTPSYGEIKAARKILTSTKLNVIIRPRGGDFLYSDIETEIMADDIRMAKELGADGVVFGCLDKEGNVDIEKMKNLMEISKGLSVTFHRAFDVCKNPFEALEQIISLGCDRILTSGQKSTAEEGIPLIKELVEKANGRIIIMPGCGVREGNFQKIINETGATEIHTSAREWIESGMIYRNPEVSMGGTVTIEEYRREITSTERIKQFKSKQ